MPLRHLLVASALFSITSLVTACGPELTPTSETEPMTAGATPAQNPRPLCAIRFEPIAMPVAKDSAHHAIVGARLTQPASESGVSCNASQILTIGYEVDLTNHPVITIFNEFDGVSHMNYAINRSQMLGYSAEQSANGPVVLAPGSSVVAHLTASSTEPFAIEADMMSIGVLPQDGESYAIFNTDNTPLVTGTYGKN